MISWIRDLPEWATGAAMAGAAWFVVSYSVLAPRAMEAHAKTEVAPPCVLSLEREQDQALAKAQSRFEEERRKAQARVAETERQLAYAEQMMGMMNGSGLGDLMKAFGAPAGDMVQGDLQDLRQQVDTAKHALTLRANFENFRLPKYELFARCICAALAATSGMRTSYALSLASFRLFTLEDLSEATRDVTHYVGRGACGDKPWEDLS